MGKRVVLIVVAVIVAAGLIGGGIWLWSKYGSDGDKDTGRLTASGTIEAETSIVSSLVGGRIDAIAVSEGDEVTSGTALFEIDDEILRLQVDQARAGVTAAQATLDNAKTDKASATEIAQAQARLDQANAALAMAEVQVGWTTITTPVEGVVAQIDASVGEMASPGKTLATIAQLDRLHVSVYVSESRIAQIELQDRASVTADGSSRTFEGTVTFIASEAEFTPSNIQTAEERTKLVYEVKLAVDNIGSELKPGMPVDVLF